MTAAVSAKLSHVPAATRASGSVWPSAYRNGSAKRNARAKLAITSRVPATASIGGSSIAISTTWRR